MTVSRLSSWGPWHPLWGEGSEGQRPRWRSRGRRGLCSHRTRSFNLALPAVCPVQLRAWWHRRPEDS